MNTAMTMTARMAARELGVSRETVFTLARQGTIRRAGYKVKRKKRVTLFDAGDVLREKNRRDALRKLSHRKGGKLPTLPEERAARGHRTAGTVQSAEAPATPNEESGIGRGEAQDISMRTAWLVALGAIIAIVAMFAIGLMAKNTVSPQSGGAAVEERLTK